LILNAIATVLDAFKMSIMTIAMLNISTILIPNIMEVQYMETPKTMRFEVEKEVSYKIEVDIEELRKYYPEIWDDYVAEDSAYEDGYDFEYEDDVAEFVKEVLYSEGEDIDGVKQTGYKEIDNVYYRKILF